MWNTNDWTAEEEDKHWEMTEEDTDDEFDDVALARLGVEIPECARETRPVYRPRVRDMTNESDIAELMRTWTQTITEQGVDSDIQTQIMEGLASIQTEAGSFHFGDDEARGGDEYYDPVDDED